MAIVREKSIHMQILVFLVVASLFVISPSLLHLLGIGYASGNPVFGIHVSAYLLIFSSALAIWFSSERGVKVPTPRASIYALVVAAILIPFVALTGDSGFKIAVLLVTFISPALLLILLAHEAERSKAPASFLLAGFMFVNSLIGFYEFGTGQRVLPYIVGNETVLFDPRPTALLGHPLNDALVTGGYLLSLLILAVRRPRLWVLAGVLYYTASMISFGGRASLVLVFVVFAIFGVYQAVMALLTMRAEKSVIRMALLIGALAIAAPIVLSSPLAAAILDRFENSAASDNTRFAAVEMLTFLSPMQLMTGVNTATRTALQMQLQSTRGVELSWVSLTLNYGLPGAIALVAAMISLLVSGTRRNRDMLFLVVFFVLSTFTALSIGSRSLGISQFIIMMFCGPLALYGVQRSSRSGRAYKVVKRRVPAPASAGETGGAGV